MEIEFVENGDDDREWDVVIVFDGLSTTQTLRVREGGLVFVAGEPPDALTYTNEFLQQFDSTFCAHVYVRSRPNNIPNQYYNNWHFGYESANRKFRWSHEDLVGMTRPEKTRDMSVIMSDLAYMPNHLRRRYFLGRLKEMFGDRVDIYGRGHRFIPFKEDALLPYRYHVCIENCVVPDLWTEKLADPFLSWSVPVYGGCPNVDRYFLPESLVRIDIEDVEGSLATIGRLLDEGQAGYESHLEALENSRRRILETHNITSLAIKLAKCTAASSSRLRQVQPNEQTVGYRLSNILLRTRRFAFRSYFMMTRGKGVLSR